MSEYCSCCSSNAEWLQAHHDVDLNEITDSDPNELADEIWEYSKEELGENAPSLSELIVLIENLQYVYQPATVRRVSIHEAGHAVINFHYHSAIGNIQVGLDANTTGTVKPKRKPDSGKNHKETDPKKAVDLLMIRIEKNCHIRLAGIAALHILDGKKDILPTLGARNDFDSCRDILKAVLDYSASDQEICSLYLTEVVRLLEEQWKAVEALAQVLEDKWSGEYSFIAGEEAERIIQESLKTTT